jgi:rhodanese-related sulfurtransferase
MRWKQFFTPVTSLNTKESRELMDGLDSSEFNLIDVRQPREYQAGHLPGARLIPMAELDQRIGELDKGKPTLVY